MHPFRTLITTSLAAVFLAGLSSVASATITTTAWAIYANCHAISETPGAGCAGDDGGAISGNEHYFTPVSDFGNPDAEGLTANFRGYYRGSDYELDVENRGLSEQSGNRQSKR